MNVEGVVETSDVEEDYIATFPRVVEDSSWSPRDCQQDSRDKQGPARKRRRIERSESPDPLDIISPPRKSKHVHSFPRTSSPMRMSSPSTSPLESINVSDLHYDAPSYSGTEPAASHSSPKQTAEHPHGSHNHTPQPSPRHMHLNPSLPSHILCASPSDTAPHPIRNHHSPQSPDNWSPSGPSTHECNQTSPRSQNLSLSEPNLGPVIPPESPPHRSLRPRTRRQLNPYLDDKIRYKRLLKHNPDAIVLVKSPSHHRKQQDRDEVEEDGEYYRSPSQVTQDNENVPRRPASPRHVQSPHHLAFNLPEISSSSSDEEINETRKEGRALLRQQRKLVREERKRQKTLEALEIRKSHLPHLPSLSPVAPSNVPNEVESPQSPTIPVQLNWMDNQERQRTPSPAASSHPDPSFSMSHGLGTGQDDPWDNTTYDDPPVMEIDQPLSRTFSRPNSVPPVIDISSPAQVKGTSSQVPSLRASSSPRGQSVSRSASPILSEDELEGLIEHKKLKALKRTMPMSWIRETIKRDLLLQARGKAKSRTEEHEEEPLLPGRTRRTKGKRSEVVIRGDSESSDEGNVNRLDSRSSPKQATLEIVRAESPAWKHKRGRIIKRPSTKHIAPVLSISSDSSSEDDRGLDDVWIERYMEASDSSPNASAYQFQDHRRDGEAAEYDMVDYMLNLPVRVGGRRRASKTRRRTQRHSDNHRDSRAGPSVESRKNHPKFDLAVGGVTRDYQPTLHAFQREVETSRKKKATTTRPSGKSTLSSHRHQFIDSDEDVAPNSNDIRPLTSRERRRQTDPTLAVERHNRRLKKKRKERMKKNDLWFFVAPGRQAIVGSVNNLSSLPKSGPTTSSRHRKLPGTTPTARPEMEPLQRRRQRHVRTSAQSRRRNAFETVSMYSPFARALTSAPSHETLLESDIQGINADTDSPLATEQASEPEREDGSNLAHGEELITMSIHRPEATTRLRTSWLPPGHLLGLLDSLHIPDHQPGVQLESLILEGCNVTLDPHHSLDQIASNFDGIVSQVKELFLGLPTSDFDEDVAKWTSAMPAISVWICSIREPPSSTLPQNENLSTFFCRIKGAIKELVKALESAFDEGEPVTDLAIMICWWSFEILVRTGSRFDPWADAENGFNLAFRLLLRSLLGLSELLRLPCDPLADNPAEKFNPAEVWHSLLHVLHISGDLDVLSDSVVSALSRSISVSPWRLLHVDSLFRLLYFLEHLSYFSADHIAQTDRVIELKSNWKLVNLAFTQTKLSYETGPVEQEATRDILAKVMMYRCYRLCAYWGWSVSSAQSDGNSDDFWLVFKRLMQLCSTRRFANIEGEDLDFPRFLVHCDWSLLALNPLEGACKTTETIVITLFRFVYHLATSGLITGSQKTKTLSQMIPKGTLTFSRGVVPSEHDLSMLYNRLAAIGLAIRLDPGRSDERIRHAKGYVDLVNADATTRLVVFRGWMYLAVVLISERQGLGEMIEWGRLIMDVLVKEAFLGKGRNPVHDHRAERFAVVQFLGCLKRVVSTYTSLNGAEYPDIRLLEIITPLLGPEMNLGKRVTMHLSALLTAFLDGRDSYLKAQQRQQHHPSTLNPVVGPVEEESQEWGFEDLDLTDPALQNDPALQAALGEVGSTVVAEDPCSHQEKTAQFFVGWVHALLHVSRRFLEEYPSDTPFERVFKESETIISSLLRAYSITINEWKRNENRQKSWTPLLVEVRHWEKPTPSIIQLVAQYIGSKVLELDPQVLVCEPESSYWFQKEILAILVVGRTVDFQRALLSRLLRHSQDPLFAECSVSPFEDADGQLTEARFSAARVHVCQGMLTNLNVMYSQADAALRKEIIQLCKDLFSGLNSSLTSLPTTSTNNAPTNPILGELLEARRVLLGDCIGIWTKFSSLKDLSGLPALKYWADQWPTTLFSR